MSNTSFRPTLAAITLEKQASSILKSDKSAKAKLTWVPLNLTDPDLVALYDDLRQALANMKAAKEAFEDAACGPVARHLKPQPGEDVIFGYRFGLAAAITTKADAAKAKANAITL